MTRRLAAVLMAVLAGCQSPYWQDRWKDTCDVMDVSISVGGGVSLHARATEALQLGFGSFDGYSVGFLQFPISLWKGVSGWRLPTEDLVREQRHELGISLLHYYEYRRSATDWLLEVRHPRYGDPGYEEWPLSYRMFTDRRPWDVGAGAHMILAGASFVFRLDELADLLTGLVGYDLLADDVYAPELEELQRRASSFAHPRAQVRAFEALKLRGEEIYGFGIYTAYDARPRFQREAVRRLKEYIARDSEVPPELEPTSELEALTGEEPEAAEDEDGP